MHHKLLRFTRSFMNKPHLIQPEALETIFDFLDDRNSGDYKAAIQLSGDAVKNDLGVSFVNDTALIPVNGPLTYQSSGWEALCGGQSYVNILAQAESAIEKGAKTIVMDFDTPGGEAFGMMETANELRAMADNAGVQLIGYVDGLMASAGMGLGSAMHLLVANPESQIGSVGVVMKLTDTSEAEESMGVKTTFVFAGEDKIPFKPEGGFREEFLSDLQDKVDVLFDQFTSHVANLRGLSQQQVIDTQAKVFLAAKAKEIGFVDELMTRSEFNDYLQARKGDSALGLKQYLTRTETHTNAAQAAVEQPTEEMNVANVEMQAQLEAMQAQMADVLKQNEKLSAIVEQKEQAELASKKEHFKEQASGWGFAGIDCEAFADQAVSGKVDLQMFVDALDKSKASLEEQEGKASAAQAAIEDLGEIGAETEQKPLLSSSEVEKDLVKQAIANKFSKENK